MWRSRVIAARTALKFTIGRSKSSGQTPYPIILPQVQFSKPNLGFSRFSKNYRFLSHDSTNPSVDDNVDGEMEKFDGEMEEIDGGSDDAHQVFDENLELDLPEIGGEDLFREESSGFGLRNEDLGSKNVESGSNGKVSFGNFSFNLGGNENSNLGGNENSGTNLSNGDMGSKNVESVVEGDGSGSKVSFGDWNFNLGDFESRGFDLTNEDVDSEESVVEVEGQEFDPNLFGSVLSHLQSRDCNGGNVGDRALLSSLDNISLKLGDDDGSVDADGVNTTQLEKLLSLLQRRDVNTEVEGLNSRFEHMNLNLNEEFVMKVILTPCVPSENLLQFYSWAASSESEEGFSVTARSLDALVRVICFEMKGTVAYRLRDLVLELGKKKDGVVTTESLNKLIGHFSRLGKGMAGYEVFSKFEDLSCVPNPDTYYLTIEGLCKRSILDKLKPVCDKMIMERMFPEPEKVGKIISYLCKAGKAEDAYLFYCVAREKKLVPRQSDTFLLISSLCRAKEKDDHLVMAAKSILHELFNESPGREKRKNLIDSCSWVIQGLCRHNNFSQAESLLSDMINEGPPPGNVVFNDLINGLSKAGDMQKAIEMMRLMESRGLKPDLFTYNVMMSGYVRGGEMEEVEKILVEAKTNYCKLTPVTYHILIRGYCNLEQFDKAINLLGEMEENGVRPTADEYSKLIQTLCLKAANWETAEKLMAEMKEKGLYLTGITRGLVRAVKELEEEAVELKEDSVAAQAV